MFTVVWIAIFICILGLVIAWVENVRLNRENVDLRAEFAGYKRDSQLALEAANNRSGFPSMILTEFDGDESNL